MKSHSVQLTHTAHHFNLDSRWISVTQQELLEIRKHEHFSNGRQESQASVLVLFWGCHMEELGGSIKWELGNAPFQDCRAEGAVFWRMWLRWSRIRLQCSRAGFDPLQYSEWHTTVGGEKAPRLRLQSWSDCLFKRTQGSSEPHKAALLRQRNGETLKGLHRDLN